MNETLSDRIILCQPDNIKGCSLCCGLFNYRDISQGTLTDFLKDGNQRESIHSNYESFVTPINVRDRFSHICPYQGFLSAGKPGCLIHPLSCGTEGRGRSLFAGKICNDFFCPAHAVLADQEKLFLIDNISDWYLYSVALADPESYSFIYNYVKENFGRAEEEVLLVREGLSAHAVNLAVFDGAVFCYSIPEYNINKSNFCIKYIKEKRDLVVSRILKFSSLTE